MIAARGRHWRVELQGDTVVVDLHKATLPPELRELRDARFDVPLKRWNVLIKNVHSDRKLLGGILLDFAKDKERVNLVVASDPLLLELRRCAIDATLVMLEEESLVLEPAVRSEETR